MPVVFNDERKLATVERVTAVRPIEGADSIEAVTVRGWTVVVKKGEFAEGSLVLYFEEDTALPLEHPAFAFLAPRGAREWEGHTYHVLRTAKLRGVYSQGLVLPLGALWEELVGFFPGAEAGHLPAAGTDVTHALGLGKWEAPLPTGEAVGPFLTKFASKTDSERVQNLGAAWEAIRAVEWEATEKVDGTSCTVARDEEGRLRVMGRNWELKEGSNTYWTVVKRFPQLFEVLEPGDAVQLEVAGPGIQGNKLALESVRPFVFGLSRARRVTPRSEWPEPLLEWAVPLLEDFGKLPESLGELVEAVSGMKSVVNPAVLAEGIVFHSKHGEVLPELGDRAVFKVISNKFLEKAAKRGE